MGNSFIKYVGSKYYDVLLKKSAIFIKFSLKDYLIEKNDLINIYDIEIDDLNLMSLFIDDKGGNEIYFDINCQPDISFTGVYGKYRDHESFSDRVWITISCKVVFDDSLHSFIS